MQAAVAATISVRSLPALALDVVVVTTWEGFLELEGTWNALVDRAGIDHPFLEHAWLRTWWECFGAGSSLRILLVKAGDRPIAIAPLILTTVRMWGIRMRRLGFFYNDHVPRADFIIAERSDQVYAAIWRRLLQDRKDWDLIQLCQLTAGSDTPEALQSLATRDGRPWACWTSGASPYVPLARGWDAYHQSLPAKHRSNLRNRFKRLSQTGEVTLDTVMGGARHNAALGEGFRLEAAAWKGAAGTAISNDPAIARFYTGFSQRAANHGWLRLTFLRAGETAVAFDYSLVYRNRTFLLKLGYDPAFSAFSPSNLLLALAIKDACDKERVEYDFLGDDVEWKRCWTSSTRAHSWLYIFDSSLKGRFVRMVKFALIPWLKQMPALRRLQTLALQLNARNVTTRGSANS